MTGLREQLQPCFRGRVCLVGLGNVDWGDDGFGVRLAEKLTGLADAGGRGAEGCTPKVLVAGAAPERFIWQIGEQGFDHVVFLDAVEFGARPGSVVFLNSSEMAAKFPQISTHKITLGSLAKIVEGNGVTRAWLLGVQPASLKPAQTLTETVQTSLNLLGELLVELNCAGPALADGQNRVAQRAAGPAAKCRATQRSEVEEAC